LTKANSNKSKIEYSFIDTCKINIKYL